MLLTVVYVVVLAHVVLGCIAAAQTCYDDVDDSACPRRHLLLKKLKKRMRGSEAFSLVHAIWTGRRIRAYSMIDRDYKT